ncbi:hypothetical protein D3C87_1726370 [compost metagenome]
MGINSGDDGELFSKLVFKDFHVRVCNFFLIKSQSFRDLNHVASYKYYNWQTFWFHTLNRTDIVRIDFRSLADLLNG